MTKPNAPDEVDEIVVDPLPEPSLPFDLAEPGASAEGWQEPEAEAEPPSGAAVEEILGPLLEAPFYLAGLWLSRGLPDLARRAVRLTWKVEPDELGPVVRALAPIIPAELLASRAARYSPGLAAAMMLAGLVQERMTATTEIRQQYERGPTDGTPQPEPSPDAAPAARGGRDDRGRFSRGQPAAPHTPPGGGGFEGAGLGLAGDGDADGPGGRERADSA